MLDIINTSINEHTNAILNSIIPKISHYIDEAMLHRPGKR